MKRATKQDLINFVEMRTGLNQKQAKEAVEETIKGIQFFTQQQKKNVELRLFGRFKVITRKAKKSGLHGGFNIPPKRVVKFFPSYDID